MPVRQARQRARSILPASLLCVTVVAATMLTAACGGSSSGTKASSSSSSSSNDSALLGPAKAASGTPVKVGWVSTGKTEAIDTSNEIKAAQATVDYANARLGGLAGHPIKL